MSCERLAIGPLPQRDIEHVVAVLLRGLQRQAAPPKPEVRDGTIGRGFHVSERSPRENRASCSLRLPEAEAVDATRDGTAPAPLTLECHGSSGTRAIVFSPLIQNANRSIPAILALQESAFGRSRRAAREPNAR